MKRSKLIQRRIISFLSDQNKPVSTREISMQINRAWHSVQLNCMKLQIKGEIDGLKIGNINAWIKK